MKIHVSGLSELPLVAGKILTHAGSNKKMVFVGAMGAGKTTLIKAICQALDVEDNVASPTFAIINEYNTRNNARVYHFDFYRIHSLEEVYDLGYEDYFFGNDYCFVEWPEKIEEMIPDDFLTVRIHDLGDERRIISIE